MQRYPKKQKYQEPTSLYDPLSWLVQLHPATNLPPPTAEERDLTLLGEGPLSSRLTANWNNMKQLKYHIRRIGWIDENESVRCSVVEHLVGKENYVSYDRLSRFASSIFSSWLARVPIASMCSWQLGLCCWSSRDARDLLRLSVLLNSYYYFSQHSSASMSRPALSQPDVHRFLLAPVRQYF